MFTDIYSPKNTVFQKIIEEVKIELQRDNQSKEVQKLDDTNSYVAKERSQIFSFMREVKPQVGSILAVELGFGFIEHTGIYRRWLCDRTTWR